MIVYGYAKEYKYSGDGALFVKVRIPNIHGPYVQTNSKGKKRYVRDEDLPFYPAILMPHLPGDGEVVMLASHNSSMNNLVVLGLTGASYKRGATDLT